MQIKKRYLRAVFVKEGEEYVCKIEQSDNAEFKKNIFMRVLDFLRGK